MDNRLCWSKEWQCRRPACWAFFYLETSAGSTIPFTKSQKMKRTIFFSFIFVLVVTVLGCGDSGKPKDLPKLHPTTIKISLNGQPLEGAIVTLAAESDGKWLVSGLTESDGTVKLSTEGKYSGAPAGKYAVCVTKVEWVDGPTAKLPPPTDPAKLFVYNKRVADEKKDVMILAKEFANPKTTPLKMEVVSGKNNQEFEVTPAK